MDNDLSLNDPCVGPVVYSASKQGKIVIDDKFYW